MVKGEVADEQATGVVRGGSGQIQESSQKEDVGVADQID
jgi:hypothetical protein